MAQSGGAQLMTSLCKGRLVEITVTKNGVQRLEKMWGKGIIFSLPFYSCDCWLKYFFRRRFLHTKLCNHGFSACACTDMVRVY